MRNYKKLCLLAVMVATAALILGSCVSQPEKQSVTPTTPEPADWPMFRFSLDRAGYNPNETRLKPPLALKWEHKTGSKI